MNENRTTSVPLIPLPREKAKRSRPLVEIWQDISESRHALNKRRDRIVLLSDFLKLFDDDYTQGERLVLQDSLMHTRHEFMGILLNLVIQHRIPMFELPRMAAFTENPRYLQSLMSEGEENANAGLDRALEQLMVIDPTQERKAESKGRILFGRSLATTPCFYLSDLVRTTSRTLVDPNLRTAQIVGMIGRKGDEFSNLLWNMASLKDYTPHFPDHPRKNNHNGSRGLRVIEWMGGWLPQPQGQLRPVRVTVKPS